MRDSGAPSLKCPGKPVATPMAATPTADDNLDDALDTKVFKYA